MFKRILSSTVILSFFLTTLGPLPKAHADSVLGLPAPGTMVNLSPAYEPVMIKGLTVHKDNPFLFDFIVAEGQDKITGEPLKKEGEKLIKYFLASLAIPDKDVWVNLSPYEKDRTIPEALGQTDMGRDLLEQDYMLKQITASLIYPEKQLGKKFWDTVYSKAQIMYGTTQIPVNTFNKVWIMADKAEVFEHDQTAFVVGAHLKVMLEEDYLALQKHSGVIASEAKQSHTIPSQIVKQIVLPELEKEINTGRNFANLRQIFNSVILANWYKNNLKEALLNQVYADKSKVNGVVISDAKQSQEEIYDQYLRAYRKGVFNYIKEDVNAAGVTMPRKYFSGGLREGVAANPAMTTDAATLAPLADDTFMKMTTGLMSSPQDAAMTKKEHPKRMSFEEAEQIEKKVAEEKLMYANKVIKMTTDKTDSFLRAYNFRDLMDVIRLMAAMGDADQKEKGNGRLFFDREMPIFEAEKLRAQKAIEESQKSEFAYLDKRVDEEENHLIKMLNDVIHKNFFRLYELYSAYRRDNPLGKNEQMSAAEKEVNYLSAHMHENGNGPRLGRLILEVLFPTYILKQGEFDALEVKWAIDDLILFLEEPKTQTILLGSSTLIYKYDDTVEQTYNSKYSRITSGIVDNLAYAIAKKLGLKKVKMNPTMFNTSRSSGTGEGWQYEGKPSVSARKLRDMSIDIIYLLKAERDNMEDVLLKEGKSSCTFGSREAPKLLPAPAEPEPVALLEDGVGNKGADTGDKLLETGKIENNEALVIIPDEGAGKTKKNIKKQVVLQIASTEVDQPEGVVVKKEGSDNSNEFHITDEAQISAVVKVDQENNSDLTILDKEISGNGGQVKVIKEVGGVKNKVSSVTNAVLDTRGTVLELLKNFKASKEAILEGQESLLRDLEKNLGKKIYYDIFQIVTNHLNKLLGYAPDDLQQRLMKEYIIIYFAKGTPKFEYATPAKNSDTIDHKSIRFYDQGRKSFSDEDAYYSIEDYLKYQGRNIADGKSIDLIHNKMVPMVRDLLNLDYTFSLKDGFQGENEVPYAWMELDTDNEVFNNLKKQVKDPELYKSVTIIPDDEQAVIAKLKREGLPEKELKALNTRLLNANQPYKINEQNIKNIKVIAGHFNGVLEATEQNREIQKFNLGTLQKVPQIVREFFDEGYSYQAVRKILIKSIKIPSVVVAIDTTYHDRFKKAAAGTLLSSQSIDLEDSFETGNHGRADDMDFDDDGNLIIKRSIDKNKGQEELWKQDGISQEWGMTEEPVTLSNHKKKLPTLEWEFDKKANEYVTRIYDRNNKLRVRRISAKDWDVVKQFVSTDYTLALTVERDPNGKLVKPEIWKMDQKGLWEVAAKIEEHSAVAVALSKDGRLATIDLDGMVRIYRIKEKASIGEEYPSVVPPSTTAIAKIDNAMNSNIKEDVSSAINEAISNLGKFNLRENPKNQDLMLVYQDDRSPEKSTLSSSASEVFDKLGHLLSKKFKVDMVVDPLFLGFQFPENSKTKNTSKNLRAYARSMTAFLVNMKSGKEEDIRKQLDLAMSTPKEVLTNKPSWVQGGIDLNTSSGMQWKISKDGNGVEMNIDPAMLARIRRDGIDSLTPVIFKMTPITSIWPLVGLQGPPQAAHDVATV